MHEAAARNLRTAERYLLVPPLAANFGAANVAVCDISAQGARFRHDRPLETGSKSVLNLPLDGRPSPVSLEAVIIWTHTESGAPGQFVSGVRTYGPQDVVDNLLGHLQTSRRSNRIQELRSSDRFFLTPAMAGRFGEHEVRIENLSAHGARVILPVQLERETVAPLCYRVQQSDLDVVVTAQVVWSGVKAMTTSATSYRAGLVITERPELIRLAIGQLCEIDRASLDTKSLRLKLKILRARARQLAPSYAAIEASGIPAEQYLLIEGVREELRLNPEEAMHWYRRARVTIADPATSMIARPIANHPDALAVWEYLDRSVDPTIVGRAFQLPRG